MGTDITTKTDINSKIIPPENRDQDTRIQPAAVNMGGLLLVVFLVLSITLSGCETQKDIPQGALSAAYESSHFCPVDGCEVEYGPTTQQLPSSGPEVKDRWCIEVIFNRGGVQFQTAVDVVQVGLDPQSYKSWSVRERISDADCQVYK
ncbi:MAG: hypothetical protein R6U51_01315 [Anaerolineales bacterium]